MYVRVHCSTISFSIEKLTAVWNHRHPWRYAAKPNRQNVSCGIRVLLYSVCISAKEGGGIKQNRDLRLANLAVQQCTRTYIVERCGSKIFYGTFLCFRKCSIVHCICLSGAIFAWILIAVVVPCRTKGNKKEKQQVNKWRNV